MPGALWAECPEQLLCLVPLRPEQSRSAGDLTTDLRRVADAALEVPEVASSRDLESAATDTTQQLAQSLGKGAPSSNGKPKDNEIAENRKAAQDWIKKWRDTSKVAA